MNFEKQIEEMENLANHLKKTPDLTRKYELLSQYPKVVKVFSAKVLDPFLALEIGLREKIALFSLVAIDEHMPILEACSKGYSKEQKEAFFSQLALINAFYESIGGIVGYQAHVLRLLAETQLKSSPQKQELLRAEGLDLQHSCDEVDQAVLKGIEALDRLCEIYPVGGLGSRLNLYNDTGEPLPAACLPFCGRTLLEGLIRDIQAREFLYYRLFKKQVTIPIAMMTAQEKQNAEQIESICEKEEWFKRPKESFFIFSQLGVPVVTEEGKWSFKAPFELHVQPGGHGAIWQAAAKSGVFDWLKDQQKEHLLVRQINNPIAGVDLGLLAFVGYGVKENKTFGFASCEKLEGAAEGVLVLIDEGEKQRISNIEYTEFKRFGIDKPTACFPANTNVLYAHLERIRAVIEKNPLPNLILNMKTSLLKNGKQVLAGRLESMMQNLSDVLVSQKPQPLSTFLTYNQRLRTISVTKKSFQKNKSLLETPEGAFYDLLQNAHDLLQNACNATLPPFSSREDYIQNGPSYLFLYHPALGPLYALIAQKLKRLEIKLHAEVQLEIADVYVEGLCVQGSLLIEAHQLLGHAQNGVIHYSQQTGKCMLKNVAVKNRGMKQPATTAYWKNQIKRTQACQIVLEGHSEFYAENITFEGDVCIRVPDGQRWKASQNSSGEINYQIEEPDWEWEYRQQGKQLVFDQGSTSRTLS